MKGYLKSRLIFVTGYFGAHIKETAERAAEENSCEILYLDDEIEKSDGRSILRICMTMGEHEYRNKEYEILKRLDTTWSGVVCCSDGVLLDEMSRDIILKHSLIIAGTELTENDLWENALKIKDPSHAFMHFGTNESKRKAFKELYKRQHLLFSSIKA